MTGKVYWCSDAKTSKKGNTYYSFAVETDIGNGFGISSQPMTMGQQIDGHWDFGGNRPLFRWRRE